MVSYIHPLDDETPFPSLDLASLDANGLVAVGGQLSVKRLLMAYQEGIFPWFNCDDDPILWWSPDPRLVLFPESLKISKSLRKTLKKKIFTVTFDQAFDTVIDDCAVPRGSDVGTWITSNMRNAYTELHRLGFAHSVECWHENQLVGGLYGIALGRVFFGESMFFRKTDASKIAFVSLVELLKRHQCTVIDCQVKTDHLLRLGAEEIPRAQFYQYCHNTTLQPQTWSSL